MKKKVSDARANAKQTEKKDYARIRWVFRCNAAIGDEPDELPMEREDHAMFLMNKLQPMCSAAAFQLESAPTTGYLHYQGCFELTNKKRFRWIQENIRKFEYLAPMIGTPLQAWKYSTKQETRVAGPWTWGEPYGEEKKAKAEEFVKAIREQKDDRELWESFPTMMTVHGKAVVKVRNAFHIPVQNQTPSRQKLYGDDNVEVYVFFGAPGTGKSYKARELYPNIYTPPVVTQKGGTFWLTEDGNLAEVVLLEDFDGNMTLKAFNQILDPYPVMVPMKGAQVWWCPRIIIITTNVIPCNWYNFDTRQDVQKQVNRRLTYCFDFNTPEGKALTKGISVAELEERYKPKITLLQEQANQRMKGMSWQHKSPIKPAVYRKSPSVERTAPYSPNHVHMDGGEVVSWDELDEIQTQKQFF